MNRLEFLYTQDILKFMKPDKIQMLKEIIYTLYDLYINKLDFLLAKVSRESLLSLYALAQSNSNENSLNYFKKSIINKWS